MLLATFATRTNCPVLTVRMSEPIALPLRPTSRILTFAVGVLPFSCTPIQRPASLPCAITTNRAVTSLTTAGLLTTLGVFVSADVLPVLEGGVVVPDVPPVEPLDVPPVPDVPGVLPVPPPPPAPPPPVGLMTGGAATVAGPLVRVRTASDAVEPNAPTVMLAVLPETVAVAPALPVTAALVSAVPAGAVSVTARVEPYANGP